MAVFDCRALFCKKVLPTSCHHNLDRHQGKKSKNLSIFGLVVVFVVGVLASFVSVCVQREEER